jgi:hypothetical protein
LPSDINWGDARPGVLNYGLENKLNLPLEIRQTRESILKKIHGGIQQVKKKSGIES